MTPLRPCLKQARKSTDADRVPARVSARAHTARAERHHIKSHRPHAARAYEGPVYDGPFREEEATRLLWRAGFGPKPGQAERLARHGLHKAVLSLTRPRGRERLIGPEPTNGTGGALDPVNTWGDDHTWWLDRMVRTNQPLLERMTLIWHSWFACTDDEVPRALMLRQNEMMRSHALGNFLKLFMDVTKDPAMLMFLSGAENTKWSPNENYGREMMELFSLGANRGYTQYDVHEQARALTGWTYTWDQTLGAIDFRFDPTLHDDGVKRIFGHSARWDWRDSCRLCVNHPTHPSFMVKKLWDYFIPVPPPARDQRALEQLYVGSAFEIRPLVEAILQHPLLYRGPRMVTPPAVYFAGLMRASGQYVTTNAWAWIGDISGQRLLAPPNVAGWDYTRWIDTGTWMGRLIGLDVLLRPREIQTGAGESYPAYERPKAALERALRFWGSPKLSATTTRSLLQFGSDVEGQIGGEEWKTVTYRILRQNALRGLIATSPDMHTQ